MSIFYERYYIRKKEIAENVLMIAICDTEKDFGPESEVPAALKDQSSFNLGQLDLLYADYSRDFAEIEDTIE